MTTEPEPCAHKFERVEIWPIVIRYKCRLCGLRTRLYDSVDAAAGRPIHPFMSVALKGYNTVKRGSE